MIPGKKWIQECSSVSNTRTGITRSSIYVTNMSHPKPVPYFVSNNSLKLSIGVNAGWINHDKIGAKGIDPHLPITTLMPKPVENPNICIAINNF